MLQELQPQPVDDEPYKELGTCPVTQPGPALVPNNSAQPAACASPGLSNHRKKWSPSHRLN